MLFYGMLCSVMLYFIMFIIFYHIIFCYTLLHYIQFFGYIISIYTFILISYFASNTQLDNFTTRGFLIWKSKNDGLCADASTIPLQFGKNSVSGCIIRVGLNWFENCTTLRALVKRHQDLLVRGLKVAKRGNPVANNSDDWLDILR